METILIKGKRVPPVWRIESGAIVASPSAWFTASARNGPHIICGSVHVNYRPLIVAAPRLFQSLKDFYVDVASGDLDSESMRVAGQLIDGLEAVE